MESFSDLALTAGLSIAFLVGLALLNRQGAREAEQRWPAKGHFINVAGVRLHYLDRGSGAPVVLLHGNGAMAADFEASGLVDRLNVLTVIPGAGHMLHYVAVQLDRLKTDHDRLTLGMTKDQLKQAPNVAAFAQACSLIPKRGISLRGSSLSGVLLAIIGATAAPPFVADAE